MLSPGSQPVELDIQRDSHLHIRWRDGHDSTIPLRELRRACPCAECRAARSEAKQGGSLPVIKPVANEAAMTAVAAADLVGRYALKVTWKDGHDAGIYDFALLRALGN